MSPGWGKSSTDWYEARGYFILRSWPCLVLYNGDCEYLQLFFSTRCLLLSCLYQKGRGSSPQPVLLTFQLPTVKDVKLFWKKTAVKKFFSLVILRHTLFFSLRKWGFLGSSCKLKVIVFCKFKLPCYSFLTVSSIYIQSIAIIFLNIGTYWKR